MMMSVHFTVKYINLSIYFRSMLPQIQTLMTCSGLPNKKSSVDFKKLEIFNISSHFHRIPLCLEQQFPKRANSEYERI